MLDFVALHGWSLILFFAVVLSWCVLGWARMASFPVAPDSREVRSPLPEPDRARRWGLWQRDMRQADGQADLERLCDRWRGQVPRKEIE
jgi:hypothetical protein